ncbi:MAG: LamG domain-containing protein [Verrucomicrobia bacterium]|nr:LamG domain-containing protein [Verrucomicrobiota bacterium]
MKPVSKVLASRSIRLVSAASVILAIPAAGATYREAVQSDNPAAYYRFNDSSRPDINVNSGSLGAAGNATNINTHSMSGAIVGSRNAAAYFDSSARTIVPWNAELNPDASESFTIEAWFCPTSDKVAGAFVGPAPINNRYSYSGVNRQGWVYFQRNPDSGKYANNQPDVGWNFRTYREAGGNTGISLTSGKPYKLGVWQHVVTVWDGSTQTATMFIDGEEAAHQTYTGAGVAYVANTDNHDPAEAKNGPAGLSIGSYNNTEPGSNPFRGGVDEVAFYKKALTAEQIKAHYDNALDANRTVAYESLVATDGPTGYWRLDDVPPGPDTVANMGLLQSDGVGVNSPEVRPTAAGALVGSSDGAISYHYRNGSSTTDYPFNKQLNPVVDQPFTFELWVRPTSDRQNPGAAVVNNRYVKSGHRTGWVIFQRAPNSSYAGVPGNEGIGWNFRFYNGVNGSGTDLTSGAPYKVGEWQHVVVTWDGQGTGAMYIDGELKVQKSGIAYAPNTSPPEVGDEADAADFAIGAYNKASGLGSNPYEGDVDEVAFYNTALSSDQILAHYLAGSDPLESANYPYYVLTAPYELALQTDPPTPAQALQPVTYLRFGGKAAAPASNSGATGRETEGVYVTATAPVAGPQSPDYPGFEASNTALGAAPKAWVSLDNPHSLNLEAKVSLEAWVKPDATQTPLARIISHGPPSLSAYPPEPVRQDAILTGSELFLRVQGNGSDYFFGTSDGVTTSGVIAGVPTGDMGSDSWIHLVGTYDGAQWTIYRNGVAIGVQEDLVGAQPVFDGGWAIGATGNGWADSFSGGIDEVAIYGQALTADQVAAHYAAAVGLAPSISIARSGKTVTITWSGGVLQQASVLAPGAFSDVLGANSPLALDGPAGTKFYRVRK